MPAPRKTDDFMAMKGAGYYSRATIGAKHVMDNAAGLILDALARRPPPDDGSLFTMTDMGCADGGTSMAMVGRVLRDVRSRCPSRPIQMIYTDLPHNDFSQLFQTLHGLTEVESFATEIPDLYMMASATSFHHQIVAKNSLNLGHSATSSHYIQEVPTEIPDHVHMVGAKTAIRQAFEAQGARDWQNFLLLRAAELQRDGFLALFNFCIDDQGRHLGHTGGVSVLDTFNNLWRGLADEGVITDAEYRATNFPQVYRTVAQFIAPLKDRDNPVYRAGLRLEHAETRVVPCPFAEDFKRHGNAYNFATAYIPTLRSWSEPVFLAGLSNARTVTERRQIVDEFYRRYHRLVADKPEGHGMDYVHCYMICRKA